MAPSLSGHIDPSEIHRSGGCDNRRHVLRGWPRLAPPTRAPVEPDPERRVEPFVAGVAWARVPSGTAEQCRVAPLRPTSVHAEREFGIRRRPASLLSTIDSSARNHIKW
jgi:hypothetical protein